MKIVHIEQKQQIEALLDYNRQLVELLTMLCQRIESGENPTEDELNHLFQWWAQEKRLKGVK